MTKRGRLSSLHSGAVTATWVQQPPTTARPARPARVCLLGAPGDTGNLGVGALSHAIVAGLAARLGDVELTVFDNGLGTRWAEMAHPGGQLRYRRLGLRVSRRIYRPESLTRVRASARLGGLRNPVADALETADVVLDISGGDSFSDLYSPLQYRLTIEPKQLVLSRGRPLLLLPQTYGPFSSDTTRATAGRIVQAATMAWARDEDSYGHLRALLGPAFDPTRHRQGVDVAFRLPATPPRGRIDDRLGAWLADRRATPTIGVNVSGLLYNDPTRAATDFGVSLPYPAVIHELVRRLLADSDANVLLVPHVLGDDRESDERAVTEILAAVEEPNRHRLALAPACTTPGEAKWVIGRLDWFCGTRMHAAIAALSSGVPAAAIAYSRKTRGVFASCGLAGEVADARRLDDRAVVGQLLDAWSRRDQVRRTLAAHLPATLRTADEQMDVIAGHIATLAGSGTDPRRKRRQAQSDASGVRP